MARHTSIASVREALLALALAGNPNRWYSANLVAAVADLSVSTVRNVADDVEANGIDVNIFAHGYERGLHLRIGRSALIDWIAGRSRRDLVYLADKLDKTSGALLGKAEAKHEYYRQQYGPGGYSKDVEKLRSMANDIPDGDKIRQFPCLSKEATR